MMMEIMKRMEIGDGDWRWRWRWRLEIGDWRLEIGDGDGDWRLEMEIGCLPLMETQNVIN